MYYLVMNHRTLPRGGRVALPNIPERLQPYTDRKVTKRTVMTLPYNSKPHSNRKYIREAYVEAGIEPTKDELTIVVKAVRDAMRQVLPGVMDVMEWIEKEVAKVIRVVLIIIEWSHTIWVCGLSETQQERD